MNSSFKVIILLLLLNESSGFKFTILHNNDMHARYDPMKGSNSKCPKGDDGQGLCFGGFGRVATILEKGRANGSTLYLFGGDVFQGTPWYTIYKADLAVELMNMLAPDAMALGNHEFDDNVVGLQPFLDKAKFPIVCCNLDMSKVPSMENAKSLNRSVIITKLEKKIGIIGYLTPDTKHLVVDNDLQYGREIPAINMEAEELHKQGVNIIIALGHSGYQMDQEIAMKCPKVDIVVGGHSHSFLYTGAPPDIEVPEGNYPTVVTKPNGRQVPVVQAYAYTKYMGKLQVEFDNRGHLINFRGTPMLLDKSVEVHSSVKALLDRKRRPIDDLEGQVVGTTKVMLDGDRTNCRKTECNLGNFIADSMVYGRVTEGFGGIYWTDAAIAAVHSGGICASVDPGVNGSVTGEDITTVLPFGNAVSATRITGRDFVKSLEHSASLRNSDSDGGFLQLSGVRVEFNFNRPKGKRVTSIDVICADCEIPHYEELKRDKYYWVIVPNYVMNGGDGHTFFKDPVDPQESRLQLLDRELLTKYFQEHKIVYPSTENRITIIEKKRKSGASPLRISQAPLTSMLYIFYSFLFI